MKKFSVLSCFVILILFSLSSHSEAAEGISAIFDGLTAMTTVESGTSQQYKFVVRSGDSVLPETDYTLSLDVEIDSEAADTSIAELTYDSASKSIIITANSNGQTQFSLSYYARIYYIPAGKIYGYGNSFNITVKVITTGQPQEGVSSGSSSSGGCEIGFGVAAVIPGIFFAVRRRKI